MSVALPATRLLVSGFIFCSQQQNRKQINEAAADKKERQPINNVIAHKIACRLHWFYNIQLSLLSLLCAKLVQLTPNCYQPKALCRRVSNCAQYL